MLMYMFHSSSPHELQPETEMLRFCQQDALYTQTNRVYLETGQLNKSSTTFLAPHPMQSLPLLSCAKRSAAAFKSRAFLYACRVCFFFFVCACVSQVQNKIQFVIDKLHASASSLRTGKHAAKYDLLNHDVWVQATSWGFLMV